MTITSTAPGTGRAPTGYTLLAGTAAGASHLGAFALGLAGSYFGRLIATNACGSSAPSAELAFVVPAQALAVPAGIDDGVMFNHVPRGPTGRPRITGFPLILNERHR